MKFTGICPITQTKESIDVHPIYCGNNEHPGLYLKGRILSCSALGSKECTYMGGCPIKEKAPEVFKLD